MRFLSGCLFGILLVVAAFIGYRFYFSSADLPLIPAAPVLGDSDVTVTMNERFISQQVQAELGGQAGGFKDVTIDVHPNDRAHLATTLNETVFGQAVTVRPRAAVHFGVSNGRVTVDIDDVDLGGVNVPRNLIEQQIQDVKQLAEQEINSQFQRITASTGLHLVGIESTEDALVLKLSQ